MREGLLRPLACLSLLLAPVAAVQAQKDNKTAVQGTASVTLIEVPVNVIGKDGKPLSGLKAADFELFDNGKKQQISAFEVFDLQTPKAEAASPPSKTPPAVARRHWLLVFDLSYSSSTALIRAREGARSIIEKDMSPTDLTAVATLSVENGWRLLENFTSDRTQLANAVDTLGLLKTGVRTKDPLAFAFLPLTQGGIQNEKAGNPERTQILLDSLENMERVQLKASDDQERGRVSQQVGSLGKMAQLLDSVRGRKYVLLFSEGFESRLITGNAGHAPTPLGETAPTQDTAAESVVKGEIWKVDSETRFGSSTTRGFMQSAMSVFRRSDVVLNTVDIGGLRGEGDVTRRTGSGTDALFTMANETNGELVRNANQLSGALRQLIERTSLVYILAFQPANLSNPGAFHELSVKVKVPTSKVSVRSGYYEPRPYRALSAIERMLASGDLLAAGGPGQIPMHVLSAPFFADGRVAQVPVILEIPGQQLLEGDTSAATQLQIYSYASDANGTLVDFLTQEMSLDVAKLGPKLQSGGVKYFGTLFLSPGRYTLRALVRNVFTGHSALATANLTVPSIPGGEATVLPPFFRDAAASWVMVGTKPRADGSTIATEYPFTVDGESFLPAALPALTSKEAAQVTVMTVNFGAEPSQVLTEVIGTDGQVRRIEVRTVRISEPGRNGSRSFLLSFNPESLEPGGYILKVRALDESSKRSVEAAAPFEVRTP